MVNIEHKLRGSVSTSHLPSIAMEKTIILNESMSPLSLITSQFKY